MPSFVPPKKNTAFTFYVSLVSQANTKIMQANPTLAAGDVKVATDDGAPANLTTLPVVDADFTKRVKVSLSATEMNGDNITVIFSDAAGAEWCDLTVNIQTTARQIDDLAFPATSGRSIQVEIDGMVHGDLKEWLGAAPLSLTSQKVQAKDADAAQATVCTEARLSELDAGTSGKAAAEVDILKEATVVRRATAQTADAGSITLDASASATDDFYNDQVVVIVGGVGVGQARLISDYVGATKVASVVPNWTLNPDFTSVFILLPAGRVDVGQWVDVAPNALVAGRVDADIGAKTGNVALSAQEKLDVNAEVDVALDTAIPAVNTADSVNDILLDRVKPNLDVVVSTRATPAQVNTEVLDVLNTDTFAEPGQEAPPATTTLVKKIGYLYKVLRNKLTQTSTTLSVFADDGLTVDQKSTVSDDGTTYTRGELVTGP